MRSAGAKKFLTKLIKSEEKNIKRRSVGAGKNQKLSSEHNSKFIDFNYNDNLSNNQLSK